VVGAGARPDILDRHGAHRMTKRITSGAFRFLNEALGLTGNGAQTTDLDDGNVSQVLDINRVTSYGQTIGGAQGLLASNLIMTHAAAGTDTEDMDPYTPGTRINSFTQVRIADFDMWYLGSGATVVSTTQTIVEVQVGVVGNALLLGISEGATGMNNLSLARWNNQPSDAGMGINLSRGADGPAFQVLAAPFLWPRNAVFRAASIVSGAGATTLDVDTLWMMTRRGTKPPVI